MTKADIARVVYERHGGISNREAARLVEVIFETIKKRLGSGEKVQITGFGTFMIRRKRERRIMNVPKPVIWTFSPDPSRFLMVSKMTSTKRAASRFEMPPWRSYTT